MQVRLVVGLTLLLATSAVLLKMYLLKYNQDFRNLVSEITKSLQDDLLHLVTEYVDDEIESPEDQEIPENLIRNFRPPHLKFGIGNVVLIHTMNPGVIIGWDIDMTDLTKEPEYLILAEPHKLIKLDQDKIVVQLEHIKVNHKMIDQYFESFDGTVYIPNKSLRKMYPKD
ncbi:PREDICTED: uncharacterized protein LOC107173291 [Diuraphis noxia]|uniref:uncharacterized protein LOC107173291 n=1 Tax=Diuraphis noxia TaxID=143948 RepID=UPI000763A158|nr:PREDICTED: uncharacterized protein LOC107173291 [Diuraphis noxia]